MTEFELIQLSEGATAQMVALITQIIAINFTMIVAIYYFLHRAGIWLKLSAFLLYLVGSLMFLLFAVRESNIVVGASRGLENLDTLGTVGEALLGFGASGASGGLSLLINLLFWAMLLAIAALLFFWKRPAE